MLRTMALAAGLAVATAEAPAAPFDIYTDRTLWEAALGAAPVVYDDFETPIPDGDQIVLSTGIVSTNIGGLRLSTANVVANGFYQNTVDNDGDSGTVLVIWALPEPIFAFGAEWANAAGAGGTVVSGDFDGGGDVGVDVGAVLGGNGSGFLGIVGSASFTALGFRSASPTVLETFALLDFAYATPAPPMPPVPAPATLPLLAAAVALAAACGRRRAQAGGSGGTPIAACMRSRAESDRPSAADSWRR